MPQSKRSVSASCPAATVKSKASVATGHGRPTTASKSIQFTDNKHRKTLSTPAAFTGELEKSAVNEGNLTSFTGETDCAFNANVNDNAVTSRAASSSSSRSSSNTLTSNSDASSNTVISPPSPSTAARRNKFRKEFGNDSSTVTQAGADSEPTEVIHGAVQSPSNTAAERPESKPSAKTAVSTYDKERAKTRFRKKPTRSCSKDLDFTYRNTCAAETGHAVSAHFGCVVM